MLLVLFSLIALSDPPQPRLYEFALSLDDAKVYEQELHTLFTRLILEDLHPNDILIVVEPVRRQRLFFLRLDPKLAGKTARVRQKMLPQLHGTSLRQLQELFTALATPHHEQSSEPLFAYLSNAALLNHEFPEHRKSLIFLGNFIAEHENPLFSLVDRVPSLSHLDHSESIFTTVGKQQSLSGFSVHVIHSPHQSEFSIHQRERHHALLRNFVASYVQKCGGTLHSFTGNIDHLNGLTLHAYSPIEPLEDVTDKTLQSTLFQPTRITEQVTINADGSEDT